MTDLKLKELEYDGKMKIHDRFGNTREQVDMTITVINTLANDWEVIE